MLNEMTKSDDDSPRVSQRQCVAVDCKYRTNDNASNHLQWEQHVLKKESVSLKSAFVSGRCWNDCLSMVMIMKNRDDGGDVKRRVNQS